MTLPPRWIKLYRDFQAQGDRLAPVVLAMIFGQVCVIAITGSYATLTRDISRAYTQTKPASGILDIGAVDNALVDRVRAMEDVKDAEALTIIHTRTRKPNGSFGRGLLFVSRSPENQRIGRQQVEQTFPVDGPSVRLERRSVAVAETEIGGSVTFDLPDIGFTDLAVAGTVFDPALAPADQEQAIYAYMDTDTWFALGGGPLEMLEVRVAGDVTDQQHVDTTLTRVAQQLRETGSTVHLVRIPQAETHPHQNQMTTVLMFFLGFGTIAFLLSAFLISVSIEGLMVQQIRQIGVMKAIGARASQIRMLYLIGVALLGLAALVVALPVGQQIGALLSKVVSSLLNFDLTTTTPPVSLLIFWITTGMAVPVLFALRPLTRAANLPVIAAINDQGINAPRPLPKFIARLTGSGVGRLAVDGLNRNVARSLLIIGLLASAGAVTLTARNVSASFETSITIAAEERKHDLDVRLTVPVDRAAALKIARELGAELRDLPLVLEAAPARDDGLAVVRTYPDGGHGALTVLALENFASLAHLVPLVGHLDAGPMTGIILNQSAHRLLGNPVVGDEVSLSLDGKLLLLPLTAVVREYMSPARAYVAAADLKDQVGFEGTNSLRFVAPGGNHYLTDIEMRLELLGSGVKSTFDENQMAEAVSGHINIFIVILTSLGIMIAVVGFAGLTAAQGISVTERRREFGVIRAIGARRGQILSMLLCEGLSYWFVALVLAVLLSMPLSLLIDGLIGRMTFGMPLPFTLDGLAFLLWAGVSLAGTLLASTPPGIAAVRASVTTSLAHQ
ncbi:Macrolide export ATP-binding/permease protein MacB [Roseibium album]|nr:Macrolide export ATP-binding/permease protein MacB [Roseibium album]